MAYGNLKADNLIYDDNGTDTVIPLENVAGKAPLANPAFTGTPTAPTAGASVNTTQLATTEYVTTAVAGVDLSAKADKAGDTFTGAITVGASQDGHDVMFFGNGFGKYFLWDESANKLLVYGDLTVNSGAFFADCQANFYEDVHFVATGGSSISVSSGTGFYQTVGNVGSQPVLMLDYTTCELYYEGSKKLETTTNGVNISGNLIVNGTTTEINSTTLTVDDKNIELGKGTGSVTTGQSATLTAGVNTVTVASTAGYLPKAALTNLTGTANAFGSATPFVKSITSSTEFTVGDGAGNDLNHVNSGAVGFDVGAASDLTANGGGITLKGSTDKTILWTDSTDSWDFNQDIKTSGTVTDSKGDVRSIPLRAVTGSSASIAPSDAGKVVSTDNTGWTVGSGSWTAGDTVTLLNNSAGGLAITCNAVTTYLTSDGTTVTSKTLGARGMATLYFTSSTACYLQGSALT